MSRGRPKGWGAERLAVALVAGIAMGTGPSMPAGGNVAADAQAAFLRAKVPRAAFAGAALPGAAVPGHNGLIAYTATLFDPQNRDDARNQIFTIRPDGTRRHRLTYAAGSDSARWSPSGRRIAYVHYTSGAGTGATRVWMMRTDGAHKQRLTDLAHTFDTAPAWAPGGHRIVFVRLERPNTDLMIYSFDTHRSTAVHVGDGFNRIPGAPTWSPDGRTIAFAASHKSDTPDPSGIDEPQSELFTVRPDGTGLTQITHTPHWFEETPDWSPNGQRLVYRRAGGVDVHFCEQVDTISPDGTNRVRVHAGCAATGPSWSPDGQRILTNAVLVNGDHGGLWTMSPTGTDKRFVVAAGNGDWQPVSH